jgi:3-oxoadipate enol-lactonase
VRSLVLVSPATGVAPARRRYLLERAAAAERGSMAAVADLTLDNSYPEALRDQAAYRSYRARFLAQDPTGYALWNRALAEIDEESFPTSAHCPTLVVAGRDDRLRPAEKVAALAARIPGASIAILDGGHLLPVQAPQALASLMQEFYEGLGS